MSPIRPERTRRRLDFVLGPSGLQENDPIAAEYVRLVRNAKCRLRSLLNEQYRRTVVGEASHLLFAPLRGNLGRKIPLKWLKS